FFCRTVFDRRGGRKVGKSQGYRFVFSALFRFLIRSQSDERRMANPTVISPVRKAHLADDLRLHPVVAATRGAPLYERRFSLSQRLHFFPDRFQILVTNSGPHLADEDHFRWAVETEIKTPKIFPLSLGSVVTADHELLASLAFDFDPVARAAANVATVCFLGDDSF